jgi:hypothetical protein
MRIELNAADVRRFVDEMPLDALIDLRKYVDDAIWCLKFDQQIPQRRPRKQKKQKRAA